MASLLLSKFVSRYRFLPDESAAIAFRVPLFSRLFAVCLACTLSAKQELQGAGSGVAFTPVAGITTSGIYAYTRNPIYVAMVMGVLPGLALLFDSAWPLISAAPMFVYLSKVVIPVEEAFLVQHYGSVYEAYLAAVPRWIA